MENTQFDQYSPVEFIQEFFRTLFEIVLGLVQAAMHIVTTVGPLKVLVACYVFLLLLAVVSELKRHQRERLEEHRALEAALEARREEQRRLKAEKDERIAQYKQRDAKKKTVKQLPATTQPSHKTQKHDYQPGKRSR